MKKQQLTIIILIASMLTLTILPNFAQAQSPNISYNSETNTITISNYTKEAPCDFEALYQASYLNGWNVIYMQGVNQFFIYCKIIIGDTLTPCYFNDSSKQVTFSSDILTGSGQRFIHVKAGGRLTLGELIDAENKITVYGCDLNFFDYGLYWGYAIDAEAGYLYLYDTKAFCGFASFLLEVGANSRVWGCKLSNVEPVLSGSWEATVINTPVWCRVGYNLVCNNLVVTAENYLIGFTYSANNTLISEFNGETTGEYGFRVEEVNNRQFYLRNVELNNWRIYWASNSDNVTIYRQYALDLTLINNQTLSLINGALVEVFQNDVLVAYGLSDTNGHVESFVLNYGYYQTLTGDVPQGVYPFEIYVTKSGYETYHCKIYLNHPTNLFLLLEPKGAYNENHVYEYLILMIISIVLGIIGLITKIPLVPFLGLILGFIIPILYGEYDIMIALIVIISIIFNIAILTKIKFQNK